MKIYIDILLVTNAIMTLIMLEAAGRICHKVISPLRLLTACSVGGLSSLVMTIDSRGYFTAVLIVVIKLVSAVFSVLIAFGCKDPWQLLRYFIIQCRERSFHGYSGDPLADIREQGDFFQKPHCVF